MDHSLPSMDKEFVIVTHSGSFHTDDVFSVATVILFLEGKPYRLIRTRDTEVIKSGDFVVDVGNVCDPDKNFFDHHNPESTPDNRENGIPYSSFGLVWKKFGEKICESKEVAEVIEKDLVYPIDAVDNGVDTYTRKIKDLSPYLIQDVVSAFHPTWKEEEEGHNFDMAFSEVLKIAEKILLREIQKAKDKKSGEIFVEEEYVKTEDKRVIFLERRYPWEKVLSSYPEPLYVISPDSQGKGFWKIKAVCDDPGTSFKNRKDLPKSWAGKREEDLAKITGVADAVFCHKACFTAVAKSKEGAIKLVKIALENKEDF